MKIARHFESIADDFHSERQKREEEEAGRQLAFLEQDVEKAAKQGKYELTYNNSLNDHARNELEKLGYKVVNYSTKNEHATSGPAVTSCFRVAWKSTEQS